MWAGAPAVATRAAREYSTPVPPRGPVTRPRRSLLVLLPALLVGLPGGMACGGADPEPAASDARPDTPAPTRPHVVLVTLDTTRRDALSPYGAPPEVTPVATELVRDGVRFDRAYTVTPLTIPAHSSLFTGLYPPRHGVRDNGDFFLSDAATTLAERLQGAGYRTMAAVGAEVTSHHWGFAQGFDAYFDDLQEEARDERNRWRVERPGDQVADDAVDWLSEQSPEGPPLFVWMHLFDAHHPLTPPPETAVLFPDEPYQAEVAFADMQVGRLLNAMRRIDPALAHTLVVVVADHGESMGAHGEALHGVLLYDETVAIPMLMRPPGGLPAGRIVKAPASLVDVTPTVLAVAGLPPADGLDGADLSGWLEPSPAPPASAQDRGVYIESLYGWHHYGWAPQRALGEADLKLIDSTTPELYARGDRREAEDLAAARPQQVDRMRGRISNLSDAMVLEGAADAAALSPERPSWRPSATSRAAAADAEVPWRDPALADPVARLPSLRRIEGVRQAQQGETSPRHRPSPRPSSPMSPASPTSAAPWPRCSCGRASSTRPRTLLALEAQQPSSQNKSMLGSIAMRKGDMPAAIALLAAALDTDPYLAATWTGFLHALWMAGDLQRLSTQLDRAAEVVPDHPIAAGLRGVLLAMRGDCAAAAPVLDDALAQAADQPFVRHARGMCLRAQGEVDGAEDLLLDEIRLHLALPSRRALVEIYARQKRYDEQLAQLDRLIAIEPPNVLSLHARAQALFNLKRYPESRSATEACRAAAPTYPHCVMLFANVLDKLGEKERAVEVYHEALAMVGQAPPEPAAADPLSDPERYWKTDPAFAPAPVERGPQPNSPVDR